MKGLLLAFVVACTSATLLSGCASVIVRSETGVDELYLGTKTDWAIVSGNASGGDFGAYVSGLWPLALIDLPLSTALDTVLLPVDIFLIPRKNDTVEERSANQVPDTVRKLADPQH